MSLPLLVVPFARIAALDLAGRVQPIFPASRHIDEAVKWLCRAQDATPDGGVSYGYSLRGGWRPSYRETTGYIAVTFFDLARERSDDELRARAIKMMRWELTVQNPDGSFSNPVFDANRGIVFDTGQVLQGLVRAFEETQDEQFLAAAERAGDWLVRVADDDGRWSRNEFRGTPHVYNTRTAWPLAALIRIRPTDARVRVARANLDWAVAEQRDGFYDNCAFRRGDAPFTHNIAYTSEGLLGAAALLDEPRYRESALRCAVASERLLREDGFVPGQIDVNGRAAADYCCLTGNCQLAIVWARLHAQTGEAKFKEAAKRAVGYVAARQDVETADANVRGAIKGSHPIWGKYSPLTFPNWAAKFFVDAMLLCREWS